MSPECVHHGGGQGESRGKVDDDDDDVVAAVGELLREDFIEHVEAGNTYEQVAKSCRNAVPTCCQLICNVKIAVDILCCGCKTQNQRVAKIIPVEETCPILMHWKFTNDIFNIQYDLFC